MDHSTTNTTVVRGGTRKRPSRGLLASVAPRAAAKIVAALRQAGVAAGYVAEVGRVTQGRGRIRVVP